MKGLNRAPDSGLYSIKEIIPLRGYLIILTPEHIFIYDGVTFSFCSVGAARRSIKKSHMLFIGLI